MIEWEWEREKVKCIIYQVLCFSYKHISKVFYFMFFSFHYYYYAFQNIKSKYFLYKSNALKWKMIEIFLLKKRDIIFERFEIYVSIVGCVVSIGIKFQIFWLRASKYTIDFKNGHVCIFCVLSFY